MPKFSFTLKTIVDISSPNNLHTFCMVLILVGNNEGRALKAVEEIKAEYPTSDGTFDVYV